MRATSSCAASPHAWYALHSRCCNLLQRQHQKPLRRSIWQLCLLHASRRCAFRSASSAMQLGSWVSMGQGLLHAPPAPSTVDSRMSTPIRGCFYSLNLHPDGISKRAFRVSCSTCCAPTQPPHTRCRPLMLAHISIPVAPQHFPFCTFRVGLAHFWASVSATNAPGQADPRPAAKDMSPMRAPDRPAKERD